MNIDIIPQDQLARLSQLISDAETILITCHKSPDGDAIGSSLGLADYLRHLGKEPIVIVPDQYPDFLMWLPNTEKIIRYDKQRDKADLLFKIADLIFCLDYNAPSRVDEMEQSLVGSPATRVLIDHHLNPDVPADFIISEPEASSTCELVFRLVWQMGAFISELLTKRIDKDKIYRNVYHNYSESRIRLMGYVMYEKLVYMPEYNAAFYTLTKDELKRFHFVKGDAEGLVNIPQQIKGLRLSISLREDTEKDNIVWISLRSVDNFPCNLMAEEFFNGGGHLNASGGRLNCSMDEAVKIVRNAIIAYANKLK